MDKTAKKPSVMAKLLGFFTVELKNLETGAIQSKADLLIMENLFYDRKVSQTFDLKGIEGRKVKPSGKGPQSKTMFDGEWLEGASEYSNDSDRILCSLRSKEGSDLTPPSLEDSVGRRHIWRC